MKRLSVIITTVAALSITLAAGASEFREYPEFRYASGLPGGGFGVDPDGNAGFDGAMQINIPVGYTPGAGNYAITPSAAAINGGFPTTFKGKDANGTVAWGIGFGGTDHAIWLMDMKTGWSGSGESAYNGQIQILREKKGRPGVAIGVTDVFNNRTTDLNDPFAGDARSFFAVATWEGGSCEKPVYYTVGTGNGRFSPIFGGISYQPAPRVKLMAEYDSFNPNVGAAYDALRLKDNWHGILGVSLVDMDRWNVSFSITRSPHSK